MSMTALGTFYGVGIGPGDPELITLKSRRILASAPIIFVPKAKITDESLALGILLNSVVAETGAELRELVFPMSKDPEVLRPAWAAAREAVLAVLRAGEDCAFITLGDTAIYSTYMNLLAELRLAEPGLKIATSAGIASYSHAAALLNLSLVEKAERMAILPCLSEVEAMRPDLERFDTVVLMKLGGEMPTILAALEQTGLTDRAFFVSKATSAEQRFEPDVRNLRDERGGCFSMLIVKRRDRSGVLLGDAPPHAPSRETEAS